MENDTVLLKSLNDYKGTFEKVSFAEFKKSMDDLTLQPPIDMDNDLSTIEKSYNSIKIPQRKTYESAGYDFYLPFKVVLVRGMSVLIPTGIRIKLQKGYSLDIYPRSGYGSKHKLVIANTVGIVDSDYYYSDNEGHIFVKLVYEGFSHKSNDVLILDEGSCFCQGIIHEFFTASNDKDNNEMIRRNGGYGSTN